MKEINFVALPNSTSYGEVAFNTMKALDDLGVKVNLFPLLEDPRHMDIYQNHDLIKKCLSNEADLNAPAVRLWHANDMSFPEKLKGRKYGWTIFELDRFHPIELAQLQTLDKVIVCSQWAKKICGENNLDNAVVVPLALDHNIFHPNYQKSAFNDDSCKFVNVGKMELRKHDIILKCFERAFSKDDNVELHMVWKNRLLAEGEIKGWENYYKMSRLSDKIVLYDWLPDSMAVAEVLANCDCGVFPSHAEGWNLGLLQSMACGLQVIATKYSAHTEYCDNNNSFLIHVDEIEQAYDGKWFFGQGNWAKFDIQQEAELILYFKHIYKKKQNGENLFNASGVETAKRFTWENTAKRLMEALGG